MLRSKGLTEKMLLLGIDGMDPVSPAAWFAKARCLI